MRFVCSCPRRRSLAAIATAIRRGAPARSPLPDKCILASCRGGSVDAAVACDAPGRGCPGRKSARGCGCARHAAAPCHWKVSAGCQSAACVVSGRKERESTRTRGSNRRGEPSRVVECSPSRSQASRGRRMAVHLKVVRVSCTAGGSAATAAATHGRRATGGIIARRESAGGEGMARGRTSARRMWLRRIVRSMRSRSNCRATPGRKPSLEARADGATVLSQGEATPPW